MARGASRQKVVRLVLRHAAELVAEATLLGTALVQFDSAELPRSV